MGILLALAGGLIGMAAMYLFVTAWPLRDIVSLGIAIDLATLAAVLFVGGAIVLAVQEVENFLKKPPAPPAD